MRRPAIKTQITLSQYCQEGSFRQIIYKCSSLLSTIQFLDGTYQDDSKLNQEEN